MRKKLISLGLTASIVLVSAGLRPYEAVAAARNAGKAGGSAGGGKTGRVFFLGSLRLPAFMGGGSIGSLKSPKISASDEAVASPASATLAGPSASGSPPQSAPEGAFDQAQDLGRLASTGAEPAAAGAPYDGSGLQDRTAKAEPISVERGLKKPLAALKPNLKGIPSSFLRRYIPADSISGMALEVQQVAIPVFTWQAFDPWTSLGVTLTGFFARIPGAWLGAGLAKRFDPKYVHAAALVALGATGLSIPLVAGLSSQALLGALAAHSVVAGTAYGITRGVTERLLPPLIIGADPAKEQIRNTALNYAYQWVEIASTLTAFFIAVPLISWVGGSWMIGISSAMLLTAAGYYAAIKYAEPWKKAAAQQREDSLPIWKVLSLKDWLPYVFFRFVHFALYGGIATALAFERFGNEKMAGWIIGSYDLGSWFFGLLASSVLFSKLKISDWTMNASAAAVTAAFLLASLAVGSPQLTWLLAGLLGGMITLVTNQWDAWFGSLGEGRLRNLSKWQLTFGLAPFLPIAAALGIAQNTAGGALSVSTVLWTLSAAIAAAAVGVAALVGRPAPGAPSSGLAGKRILIVGSYLPDRPFIFQKADELGVEVVLIDDPSRKAEALKYVKPENFIEAPVMDPSREQEVIEAADRWIAANKEKGIALDGSTALLDAFTVLNARIAERHGLRSHGLEPILDTKHKDRMRERLAGNEKLSVQTVMVKTEDEAAAAYRRLGKGVIKPPRGVNSQFVAEIDSEEDARAQFRLMFSGLQNLLSDSGGHSVYFGKEFRGFLYEEFLDGPEVDIEIVVQDGIIKFLTVTDNLPTEPPYFMETGDNYPSQLPLDGQEALKAMAREAVAALGLKNGNIHLEARLTSRGPRVLEVNSRMGGDYVYYAIKEAWGVDLVELGLMAAAGVEIPDYTTIKPRSVVVTREWAVPKSGVIESFGEDVLKMAAEPKSFGLLRVLIVRKVGDRVYAPPERMSDKPVFILSTGATHEESLANVLGALSRVKVDIR